MARWQRRMLDEVVRKLVNYQTGAGFSMDRAKDAEIKEAIRLWLETWIESPLRVIQQAEDGTLPANDLDYWKQRAR